ncbi:hypothetical protein LCGC14_3025280, partial [marine sediment metagenome]
MMEKRYIRKDKSIVWVNLTGSLVRKPSGKPNYFIAVVENITERKLAAQKVEESEKRYKNLANQYKMLLESIADAIYALNKDWEYILVNKNAEKIVGMSINQLLGHKIFDVFPGIENTPFFKAYNTVMSTRKADRVVDSFILPNGHMGYYEVSIYPIEEGILCIGKNVSEEKEIERKLVESEEKFRTLFNNANDAIFIIDLEGSIIECNQTAYERLGYTKNELLQMTPFDLDTKKYAEKVSQRINTVHQLGELFYEVEHVRKNGTIIPVEINSKLIIFNGKSAILSVARDITERKKAESEKEESEKKLRTLNNEMEMILDYLPGLIFYKDASNKFLRVNKYLADAHNMTKEELS